MDLTGIGAIADLAKTVIGSLFPNKTEEEKAEIAAALTLVQGQLDTNKAEASNTSTFVAGWRPFIGWICGSGLGFQFIVAPLFTWASALLGHPTTFPSLDLGTLMTLLLGMLGLGGMRTVEKVNGVNSGH